MRLTQVLFVLLIAACFHTHAQTYTSAAGGPIPDDGTVVEFPLTVSGLSPSTIDTTTFGLETVCLTITHTWNSDLDIRLVAPDSTTVLLFTGVGGADDNFTNTCLNMDSTINIALGVAPFTGSYKPMGQMGLVNNGQNGNGTWKLRILDTYAFADEGTVISWSLTFGNSPAGYFTLHDSNLPIVVIETGGNSIPNDPKLDVQMGVIYNGPGIRNYMSDPFNHYDGRIGIELRGASSSGMPKKSYQFEFRDSLGNDMDTAFLGMPSESDFALIANYADKSLMRNAFSFRLWESLGRYAPRGEFVELILDGEYQGVYYLCETVKRDGGRVDIAKLDSLDVAGDDLTGGYILKVDRPAFPGWTSLYPPAYTPSGPHPEIVVHYPKGPDILPVQLDYIHAYVDSFEQALDGPGYTDSLTGYRKFIDTDSWIDFFLFTELSRGVDNYRLSTYFHKDKNSKGGKLVMGPPWDYDLSLGNADYCDAWLPTGWAYQLNIICGGHSQLVPFWWQRLLEDPAYEQAVRCRWDDIKNTTFSVATMHAWVDSVAAYLEESQQRNFIAWPILGIYVWPNYYIPADYKGEVDTLKWFIAERWAWLDANLPGDSAGCLLVHSDDPLTGHISVFPNPAHDQIFVTMNFPHSAEVKLEITDLAGKNILFESQWAARAGEHQREIALPPGIPAGMYMLRITNGIREWVQKIIIQ